MNPKQKKMLYRIIAAAVLILLIQAAAATGALLAAPVPAAFLYLVPYLVVGWDVLVKAAKGVKNRQPFDECFLMAVATVGAFALGEYMEGCAVILFYQVGELFQSVAVGKSRRNIAALMDIRPDYANLEQPDGSFARVDPDEVEPGAVIVVEPGEKVPIDGVVLEGASTLNTAALTGESLPREVKTGDEVVSGCVNLSGLLRVRTTRAFGESTVSRILDLVENSSMKKARAENFITPVCPGVYPGGLLQRPGPGIPAASGAAAGGPGRGLRGLDLPRADLPGHQLPLRAGHLHPPVPSLGGLAGPVPAASWSKAPPIWRSCPAPARWSLTRPAP